MADQLAVQADVAEDDLVMAREAGAFYLKFSESILAQAPGHLALAEAVTGGYTRYAYAFVASEADRLESVDAKAAKGLRLRAARLYARAQRHAMHALEQRHPGFATALAAAADLGNDRALALRDDEVGVAYWGAAAWAAWIALSKDQPEMVADLPQAVRLATLAWARKPDFADGGLASLMGHLELARAGGTRERARAYFDQAISAGAGRGAGPYVAKAEGLALPEGDRPAFEALLRQALAIHPARPDLGNEVMRQRAKWLLDSVDDRF